MNRYLIILIDILPNSPILPIASSVFSTATAAITPTIPTTTPNLINKELPNNQQNRLLWVATFANNSKQKTNLLYKSPNPNQDKHNYYINIYSYPLDLPPFAPLDYTNRKSKAEYQNLYTYIDKLQTN